MNKKLFFLIAIFILCFWNVLKSQYPASKWYFGYYAGLDFLTAPPTILNNGSIQAYGGCATISDDNGNLLFYTDGYNVWNQLHQMMANGNAISGTNGVHSQSSVIVKQPGNSNIYYVFTQFNLAYSVVDMSLAAGVGSVTVKNAALWAPSAQKLAATQHCNGVDYWIVAHDLNSNNFLTYLLTANGLSGPILSAVGPVYSAVGAAGYWGYLKISPNGKKIGLSYCYSLPGGNTQLSSYQLYDFNTSTGAVSNPLVVYSIPFFLFLEGCEFSPDGTKFFGQTYSTNLTQTFLSQWDLCAGSQTAVVASQFNTPFNNSVEAMQLGIDGKIYVARNGQMLGVINNPNIYGSGSNVVASGQSVASGTCSLGLPNFCSIYFKKPASFSYSQGGSCLSLNFSPPSNVATLQNNACSASGYSATSVLWNFGDVASGANNSSILSNPVHTYPAPGTYSVKLAVNTPCGTDTLRKIVMVVQPSITVSVVPTVTQSSCTFTNNAFNLGLGFGGVNPVPSYTINWSPTPGGISSNTQTGAANSAPGSYTAGINLGDGCAAKLAVINIQPVPFPAVINIAPVYSVSCAQPKVVISLNPVNSYTWSSTIGSSLTAASASFNLSSAGNWTVTGGTGDCATTQTFVIGQNFTAPSASLSPQSQGITCLQSALTVTALASPGNVSQQWLSPNGGTLTAGGGMGLYAPGGPGTYTHVVINTVNGCMFSQTFSVISSSGFPTFILGSPQNFTLGCGTKSIAIINIVGANTVPGGGSVSYTVLGPPTSTVYNIPPGGSSTYTLSVPGTWTAVTKDNQGLCETKVAFSIIQNTFQPDVAVSLLTQTLSCYTPSVILQGSSTTNVAFNWRFPGQVSNIFNDSIVVGITSVPNNSAIAAYTLVVTDNNNSCSSTTVINMYQDLRPPLAKISGGNEISCNTSSLSLTNNSSTGILPGTFFIRAGVIATLWEGPTPQQPQEFTSTYNAYLPGTYTLHVKDLSNGCMAVATKSITDNRDYPVLNSSHIFTLDCGANAVKIFPVYDSGNKDLIYHWQPVDGASVNGASTASLTTDKTGQYEIAVTNTINGCGITDYIQVIDGRLLAGFTAEPENGYAPLTVNFTNTSASSLNTSGITSVWSYGNGAGSTTTLNVNSTTLYTEGGTYHIKLFVNKGNCQDSLTKTIRVDMPSALEIPNVFTPNNDGVNDVFYLNTANLSHIEAHIYDRWGNQVYDLISETGNIAWDGKDQSLKEVPAGVYFYVIDATGIDGKVYSSKGNVSLFR